MSSKGSVGIFLCSKEKEVPVLDWKVAVVVGFPVTALIGENIVAEFGEM